jgi:hypothetical protein
LTSNLATDIVPLVHAEDIIILRDIRTVRQRAIVIVDEQSHFKNLVVLLMKQHHLQMQK